MIEFLQKILAFVFAKKFDVFHFGYMLKFWFLVHSKGLVKANSRDVKFGQRKGRIHGDFVDPKNN